MMRLRRAKKVIESLIGFYQLVGVFVNNSDIYDDEAVRGLMIYAHLIELLNYHHNMAITNKLTQPNKFTKKFYKEYIKDWETYIKTKASALENLANIYVSKRIDYII